MKSSEFKKIVAKEFAPFLREQGWKGSGFDFRKEDNDIINVLKIQASRDGGVFCIEIGVYFNFLPPLMDLGVQINPNKITTWDLDVRCRISPNKKNDDWWKFPKSEKDSKKLFKDLKKVFLKQAVSYFEKYQDWKTFIANVSIEDIENGAADNFYNSTALRTTLFVARVKEYLGEKDDAILFSEYGLSKIEGKHGSGLKEYFEKIINNCR